MRSLRPWLICAVALHLASCEPPPLSRASSGDSASPGWPDDSPGAGEGGRVYPEILSVVDAAPTDAGWLLLDGRAGRVHIVSHSGELIRSVGGPGQGPGELSRPAAISALEEGFAVADATGRWLHLFSRDGVFLRRSPLPPPRCESAQLRRLAEDGRGSLLILRRCMTPSAGGWHAEIVRVTLDGRADEPYILPLVDPGGGAINPLTLPVLAIRKGEVYLGVTTDPCLRRLQGKRASPTRLCAPHDFHIPLPLDLGRRLRSLKTPYDRISPVPLRIPATLPPFDRLFALQSGLVFRLVTGEEIRALCLLDATTGSCSWTVAGHEGSYAGDTTILHVVDELSGTRIRIAPSPVG